MATVLAPAPSSPPPQRRFSVAEYHQMIRTGLIREGERVELIHGLLVEKMSISPHHRKSVRLVETHLAPLCVQVGYVGFCQQPATLTDSEPEPDFFAATAPEVKYDDRHPIPEEVGLVVEVADSSLGYDRGTKSALYATARIPVYWVVNIPDRRVEVYTQPRGGKSPGYRKSEFFAPGQSVPVVLAGQTVGSIPVSELLP